MGSGRAPRACGLEPGRAGQGRAGLGRVASQNHTDRSPIANRNPKRDEANTRLKRH
jgi:hypothetical protein